MKYRIVERKCLDSSPVYVVQRKSFPWGWRDETWHTADEDFIGFGDYKTPEEAKNYINWRTQKQKIIVK